MEPGTSIGTHSTRREPEFTMYMVNGVPMTIFQVLLLAGWKGSGAPQFSSYGMEEWKKTSSSMRTIMRQAANQWLETLQAETETATSRSQSQSLGSATSQLGQSFSSYPSQVASISSQLSNSGADHAFEPMSTTAGDSQDDKEELPAIGALLPSVLPVSSVVDSDGERVVDSDGERVVDSDGERVVDSDGEQDVYSNGEWDVDSDQERLSDEESSRPLSPIASTTTEADLHQPFEDEGVMDSLGLSEVYIASRQYRIVQPYSNEDDFTVRPKFSEILADWGIRRNIAYTALDDLIRSCKFLDPIFNIHEMPATFKSLTKLTKVELETYGNMSTLTHLPGSPQYVHFGLENAIRRVLPSVWAATFPDDPAMPEKACAAIELWVDGIPLFGGGMRNDLWAVMGCIVSVGPSVEMLTTTPKVVRCAPFDVAMHLGGKKPNHAEILLGKTVDELVLLDPYQQPGEDPDLFSDDRTLTVLLRRLMGDTRAREFAKVVRSCNAGTGGCERCFVPTATAPWITSSKYQIEIEPEFLRHDVDFLDYDDHRILVSDSGEPVPPSPLTRLSYFGMVTGVPIEEMHIMYLLNVKALFESVRKKEFKRRLDDLPGRPTIEILFNSRLQVVKAFCPDEFTQRIETLAYVRRWKASEFRQLILYLVDSVFEGLISTSAFNLFHLLKSFMYLLGRNVPEPVSDEYLNAAEEVAKIYVNNLIVHRAGKGVRPSAHLLLHVPADCKAQNCHWGAMSCWPYENRGRPIKMCVRSPNRKLEQLRNVTLKTQKYLFVRDEFGRPVRDSLGRLVHGWNEAPQIQSAPQMRVQIRRWKKGLRAIIDGFEVTTEFRNAFVLLKNQSPHGRPIICRCVQFVEDINAGKLMVVGRVYLSRRNLYDAPFSSQSFQAYAFSKPDSTLRAFALDDFCGKLYVTPRFSIFPGLKEVNLRSLGDPASDYPNVLEWVGVKLRHTGLND